MILAVYCAGGYGGVAMALAKEININTKRWNHFCFITDVEVKSPLNEEILYFDDFVEKYKPDIAEIVIGSGEPEGRQKIYEKVKKYSYCLPNLIHPDSQANFSEIGEGNIIQCYSYISANNSHIGNNNILMPFTQIAHDSYIGDHCVIATQAVLSGHTIVKDQSYIGTGAKCRENITIGNNSIIGMGAVVTKTVEEYCVVAGIPAKVIRKNTGKVF